MITVLELGPATSPQRFAHRYGFHGSVSLPVRACGRAGRHLRFSDEVVIVTEPTFGARLKRLRERRGLTREVFGGLVGRGAEWVKAVERGRLLMPRLPLLLRMAEVLDIDDLADLVGSQSLPVESVTRGSHDQVGQVVDALLSATAVPAPASEPNLQAIGNGIDDGWRRWVTAADQKTAAATVLPDLLIRTQAAARVLDSVKRRHALTELARLYTLAQCYFAWQPAGEYVWLAADRAMSAAHGADDPLAIAVATRYYAEVYRTSGQAGRAAAAAREAAGLLDPAAGPEERARWGSLHLSVAQAEAQLGHEGTAWRHWDLADQAADTFGPHYTHPWLRFGRADVDSFAMWMTNRLFKPGETLRRADRFDWNALTSPGRKAARLLDVAEAHLQRNEPAGVVHMIGRAHRESAETVRFSLFARQALMELSSRPGMVRQEARALATAISVIE